MTPFSVLSHSALQAGSCIFISRSRIIKFCVIFPFQNTVICRRCFNLLDRADELIEQLKEIKDELGNIKQELKQNLNVATTIGGSGDCNDTPGPNTRGTTRAGRVSALHTSKRLKNDTDSMG